MANIINSGTSLTISNFTTSAGTAYTFDTNTTGGTIISNITFGEIYIDENGNQYTGIEEIYKVVAKKYFDKQMKDIIDGVE